MDDFLRKGKFLFSRLFLEDFDAGLRVGLAQGCNDAGCESGREFRRYVRHILGQERAGEHESFAVVEEGV